MLTFQQGVGSMELAVWLVNPFKVRCHVMSALTLRNAAFCPECIYVSCGSQNEHDPFFFVSINRVTFEMETQPATSAANTEYSLTLETAQRAC
jgi:hypothetical protein